VFWITTESGDVFVDPLQGSELIKHTIVSRTVAAGSLLSLSRKLRVGPLKSSSQRISRLSDISHSTGSKAIA
jgi:hypothetical protein